MHAYIQVLLEREKLYIAGCLTTLMSYKECLAVALQEGALDITVAILRAQDKVLCVCHRLSCSLGQERHL